MKKLICFLLTVLIQPVFAENTEVIKCKVSNDEWQSTVVVDSLGGGIFKFQKSGDSNFYACSMKLSSFSDMRGGVMPVIVASLKIGACDPAITTYRDKILNNMYLNIKIKGSTVSEAKLQWLQDRQPESCVIEKLKLDDIHDYAVMWSKGKWGRRPASAPQKLKKKF